ncbi:Dabb family protein [Streptomyces sp. NPDC057137]|uniref:Dabb family protein n=1 Tax=Streptomyces sp. NPDC057137 TaxID=3346030 RepID=UPI003630B00D
MFQHVALLKWSHALSPEELADVRRALVVLGEESDTVRAFVHGVDAGERPKNWDYGVLARFDDAAGWRAYSVHPAHDALRAVLAPLVEDQVVVQFELPDGEHRA